MRGLIAGLALAALLAGPLSGRADAIPGYPPMRWEEASRGNYTVGRPGPVRRIVVHATHGSYRGAISWFRSPGADLSAHYVIRASDGEITQMVREADTAWHARGANRDTIGIEHEYDPRGVAFTDAQYRASAALVCAITRRYGLPVDRTTVIGHGEVPGTDHTDPGRTWNWSYYLALIARCSGAPGAQSAPGAIASANDASANVPPAGLGRGASGAGVRSLQDRLVALGFLRPDDAATAPGSFGPFTRAAVIAFQRASGVPPTGYYGMQSAAAMSRSVARVAVPSAQLSVGLRSDEVSRLQTLLRSLGHLDVVTGYFGPRTEDAVRQFQAAHGLPVTGIYGPLTRTALASLTR